MGQKRSAAWLAAKETIEAAALTDDELRRLRAWITAFATARAQRARYLRRKAKAEAEAEVSSEERERKAAYMRERRVRLRLAAGYPPPQPRNQYLPPDEYEKQRLAALERRAELQRARYYRRKAASIAAE